MRLVLVCSATIVLSASAVAQELSPGKYSGNYVSNENQISITLDLQTNDSGNISGKGTRYGTYRGKPLSSCVGEFPVTGQIKGSELTVRAAEKFGRLGDCSFQLRGTVSGNKILGKVGQNEFELTK